MNRAHAALGSLALLAVSALGAAACGPNTPSATGSAASPAPSASPSPSVDPKVALTKAVTALNSTSERFSVSVAGKQVASGAVDVPKTAVNVVLALSGQGATVKFEVLAVLTDVYLKYDLGADANKFLKIDPKKWYKIDLSKVTDKSSLLVGPDSKDPLSLQVALDAMSGVQTTDGRTYTGTIDLSAASDSIFSVAGGDLTDNYGDKIKSVPFTATVNAQGELTSFKTDGTGIGDDVTQDIEFTDFGHASVTKPTSSVTAPPGLYNILNGNIPTGA